MSAVPLLYTTSPAVGVSDVISVAMLVSYSCCVIGTLPLTVHGSHTDTVYPSACERERETRVRNAVCLILVVTSYYASFQEANGVRSEPSYVHHTVGILQLLLLT